MQQLQILITAILFGGLWGAVQGMIMIQPKDKMAVDPDPPEYDLGVRNHRWFAIYHRLCIYLVIVLAELILLGLPFIQAVPWLSFYAAFPSVVFLIGCGVLGWEASESMYSFARYGVWIGGRESLEIADLVGIELTMDDTRQIHYDRLLGGLAMIVFSLLNHF